jgi:hypothetical protein
MATEAATAEAEQFYAQALRLLQEAGVPFMVGGAYAMREYADIYRDTKDLDVFCKPGDYPALLRALSDAGYQIELTDATWLAKAFHKGHYVDVIFNSGNHLSPVDDTWLDNATSIEILDCKVKLVPAEEELVTKMFVQDRYRHDGADVLHILRKRGLHLDWDRIYAHMEPHWEILLAHLITFQYVYPSERTAVPRSLLEKLLTRVTEQLDMPVSKERICRGPLLSRHAYEVDTSEWGYKEP